MARGDFVWCDVSTFRFAETKAFYARLFGWSYANLVQPDGSTYDVASTPLGEAAGVFVMPEKFQKIGLPSFWMPYFAVEDLEARCELAARAGGKIELGPLDWSEQDRIALIRDPLGAGFTIYQGASFGPASRRETPGHPDWRALYVSDVNAVRGFYISMFDWRIADIVGSNGAYRVETAYGVPVADLVEADDGLRGDYQFWGVHFSVRDLPNALADIASAGGGLVRQKPSFGGATTLVKDPDGAAFFIREAKT